MKIKMTGDDPKKGNKPKMKKMYVHEENKYAPSVTTKKKVKVDVSQGNVVRTPNATITFSKKKFK